MAHPSRAEYIPYLKEHLGDVPVAWDEKQDIWDTCRRAWLLHDPEADFHFVIQDDAIIGRDFHERLQKLVQNGDFVYNLYIGRPRFKAHILKIKERGGDRMIRSNIHHEIALGFPTKYIKEMVEHCDNAGATSDRFINGYVNKKKLKVFFPLPSLINHRNTPSLHNLNKGGYEAVATWFE